MSQLEQDVADLMTLYNSIKRQVRQQDRHLYERWKAGGFLVDPDIVSMYPAIEQVVEELQPESESEEDIES